MDRIAIARAERRRQAQEELDLERDRGAALQEEVARLVAELVGPSLDEEVFAQLAPADVELVQGFLQGERFEPDEVGEDEQWFDLEVDDPETLRAETEEEIRRLEAEIAASRRRQEAFQRYLRVLGG